MAYGVKYRFEFYSKISDTLNRIDILEDAYVGSVNTLPEMGPVPITIKWDGEEGEKNTPIIASEATLQFVQSETFDIDTFFSNTDQKYKVNHYLNGRLNWTGFTQTDDLQQPYQDAPNYFTVRAVDGLAYLKTINLTGTDGEGIWGANGIMYYCQRCLVKTGHELNINNWINIFPYENYGSGSFFSREFNAQLDPFNLSFLYGQSFMTGKNQWDNCYSVLSSILSSFQARCFQWDGEWHFVRTEDYIYYNDLLSCSQWEFDAWVPSPSALIWEKDFSVSIGSTLKQINRSLVEGRKRAVKSTKLTHVFNQWPQIIRNDRFLEGDYESPLSSPTSSVYTLEHWELSTFNGSVLTEGANAHSRFELTNGYVTDQYMFIVKASSVTYKVRGSGVPVIEGDKMDFSYRVSQSSSVRTNDYTPAVYCYLRINSTDVYWLGKDGKWYSGIYNESTQFITNSKILNIILSGSDDPREWRSYSVNSTYFPADGTLYVEFWSDGISGSTGDEGRFGDIEVSIIPFVYNKVSASGQADTITNSENIINRFEEDLFIANTTTPTNQGYLFTPVSGIPLALTNWCHHQIDEQIPFIRIINLGHFRSLYRAYYTLDGNFVGVIWDDGGTIKSIGMINSFYTSDNDKRYLTSGLEIDYKNETVNAQLIELFIKDGNDDTEAGDSSTFRYLDIKDFAETEAKKVTKTRNFIKKLIDGTKKIFSLNWD